MFVHTVIMVIEPHMKQGRQHKLISTIFLATSVTKKLDHNTSLNQSFRYDPRSMDLGQRVPFQNPAQFQKFLNLSRILEYCFALYFLCSQAFLSGFPPDIF